MNKRVSTQSKLLVVGSVAFDSIKTPFGKIDRTLGGSASYFSLAASFFTKPSVIAVVGEDFKNSDRKILQRKNIDLSGLEQQKGKSFFWRGEYNFDLSSRETLELQLNVFSQFKPRLLPHHKQARYVFLGNIHPKLQLEVLKQIKKPTLVGLDTIDFWIEKNLSDLKKVLKLVDVFVINESEARELSQEFNLVKAAKKILGMMSKHPILIIKQGEHGLLMFSSPPQSMGRGRGRGLNIFNLPGFPLEKVFDPTGAGDSFAGGFMGYLASVDDVSDAHLKRACVYGSVVASFCVENFGTKSLEKLTRANINHRFQQFKHLTHFEIK